MKKSRARVGKLARLKNRLRTNRRITLGAGIAAAIAALGGGYLVVTSSAATASTVTITTAANSSHTASLEVGFDYTQDSSLFGNGNQAAANKAIKLLSALDAPQAVHLMGFGTDDPKPTATSAYNWRSLDDRVAVMRKTTPSSRRVMTLCCAPKWVKGTAGDWDKYFEVAPKPAQYANYAKIAADAAKRYPDISYFVVWNELKGFNGNYTEYTKFYNVVYDAVKKARPDAKVGGPYAPISVYPVNKVPKKSSVHGDYGMVNQQDLDGVVTWLKNKHGADFIAFDGGAGSDDKGKLLTNGYTAGDVFGDTSYWLRHLDAMTNANRTNMYSQDIIKQGKTLPVYWMEFYPATKGASGQHAASIALDNLRKAEDGGVSRAFLWEAEGYAKGDNADTHAPFYTDARSSKGGESTAFYNAVRALHANFPVGTPLYDMKVSNGDVRGWASRSKALLMVRGNKVVTVTMDGKQFTLKPYEIRLVNR